MTTLGATLSTVTFPVLSLELIADTELANSTTHAIDITSIPSTYKHLLGFPIFRSDSADVGDTLCVTFNDDGGAVYTTMNFQIYHSNSISTSEVIDATSGRPLFVPGDLAPAGVFSSCEFFVANYASANMVKQWTSYSSRILANTTGNLRFVNAFFYWHPAANAAITKISMSLLSGNHFKQYSRFSLFGVS